jgi:hypothetical protein
MGRSTSTSASRSELFVAVLTAALVFLMAARTPLDSDLFWHLRAGSDSLQTLRPVLADTYSYTRAGQAWVNHSWLGQVVLAFVFRAGGWFGLSALVAVLATLSMVMLFRRMSGPPLWRAFIIILTVLVAAPVLTPRPQIFSLCLLVLLDTLLERYAVKLREPSASRLSLLRQPFWWVLGLFILWSNLHGGYVLGLILLGCRGAGELLDRWAGRQASGSRRAVVEPLVLAALGLLVAAINPNGAAMWRIPFQTVGVGALQNAIPEWASPDFHDLVQQPFLWMLVGLLGALGLAERPRRGGDLLKVVVFAAMGLAARRNFAPFALVAAPLLSASGWEVFSRWSARLQPPPEGRAGTARRGELPGWLRCATNLCLFGLIALAALGKLVFVSHPAVVGEYLRRQYPAGAAEFLRAQHPDGQLFSTYAWGGYLIWALPEYPVFIDGRTDLYGDAVIGEWLAILAARQDEGMPGWADLLAQRGVAQVLLEPGQPLLRTLTRAGWKTLYADKLAVIMRRPD